MRVDGHHLEYLGCRDECLRGTSCGCSEETEREIKTAVFHPSAPQQRLVETSTERHAAEEGGG